MSSVDGFPPFPIADKAPLVFAPADNCDTASLEEVCRSNGWLKDGGYAWQDDSAIGERPFAFCRTSDMEGLGAYLRQCPRPLRQGIVYGDLALIQQSDFGDDWWALRRDGDGWAEIGSVPATSMANDMEKLRSFVESAIATDPEALRARECLEPRRIASILCNVSLQYAAEDVMDEFDDYGAFRESVEHAMADRPDLVREFLDQIAEDTGDVTAAMLAEDIKRMTRGTGTALSERARTAAEASDQLGRDGAQTPSRALGAR